MIKASKRSIIILLIFYGCSPSKEEYCKEYILQSQTAIDSLNEKLRRTQQLLGEEVERANLHSEMYMELKMKYDELE